jgi:hypothetical protein
MRFLPGIFSSLRRRAAGAPHCIVNPSDWLPFRVRGHPRKKKRGAGPPHIATWQAVAVANQSSPEIRAPRETDCGIIGSAEPGTTRGSPRRSRTAKASRISRHAVKSRCADEWDGWGRLSDDGPGHHNPDPSEDPWGGGVITLQGGAQSSARPDTVRDNRCRYEVHEGRMQTEHRTAYAGSRLKPLMIREGTAWKASPPAVLGKTRRTE